MAKHKILGNLVFVLALALTLGASTASADIIIFTNTYAGSTGTGFGSIDSVLQLQTKNGQQTFEYGAVSWNGSMDVTSGTKTGGAPHSQTLTASHLTSAAGTNISWDPVKGADFKVIFQVNQEGKTTLDLHKFQLDFFKANGSSALASVVYTDSGSPSTAALGGVGVGTSGWVFNVHLDGASAQAFFGTGTNRLGMSVLSGNGNQIDNLANDGPDHFYVAAGPSVDPTPEPQSVILLGLSGLGLLGFHRWNRRAVPGAA